MKMNEEPGVMSIEPKNEMDGVAHRKHPGHAAAPVDLKNQNILQVLVAEDSPADQKLLRIAIEESGAKMVLDFSKTMAEARSKLEKNSYDCVLLDLGLPDADGIGNIAKIKGSNKTITIIIMTGLDSEEAALQALQSGAQDYLAKGNYDGLLINRLLRRAIERNRILNEVEQLREYQYYVATHDALTGLANRSLFEEHARTALTSAARDGFTVGIGYLDLDGFKAVNDLHGHSVGDILLREVGHLLSESLRGSDTVARMGGDEFALLLSPVRGEHVADEIAQTVKRLQEKISSIKNIAGHEVKIAASVGIALSPDQGRDLKSLLIMADKAMYEQKRKNKGREQRSTKGIENLEIQLQNLHSEAGPLGSDINPTPQNQ